MSALLDEHMKTLRLIQACDSSGRMGPALPDAILSEFQTAIASGNLDGIRTLLAEHFPDTSKRCPGKYNIKELLPALSQAARHDQVDVLKEILVPYLHSPETIDFVAYEAVDTCSKNTLLLLLDLGWDINLRFGPGLTVLESFLYDTTPDRGNSKRRDMTYWLIDHGAGLNERPSHTDTTGMSYAVEHAPVDFVQELLDQHGGDAQKGQLLHHALQRKPTDGIVDMLRLLIDRGAPLNVTKFANDERASRNFWPLDLGTPLHEAADRGNVEAVKFLLEQGADTNIVSSRSKTTAREWAEKAGHSEIAAILRSPDQYKI
ncbi:hypothetical protein SCUCBS95973_006033 [Sporothrix curviconia]|uniref:Ankyrin repeat protein n=1 Tax=Sporothrix curviconia TaxID=1260050 RepID=A0ABP0C1R0_9PEZI